MKMGYLYVLKAGAYCKVGITDHSVYRRMKLLQTGCPLKIEKMWSSKDIPNYKECEKELHKKLQPYCSSGEWFHFPYVKACMEADKITRDSNTDQDLLRENMELKSKVQSLETKVKCLEAMLKNDYRSEQWAVN